MRRLLCWTVPAGLFLAISSVHAQDAAPYGSGRAHYSAVSDIGGPYAAMPPDGPGYGYDGPRLMPGAEVYAVLRDNGFSPLGIPRQRGFFYTIAAMDRRGNDGRLVIDGRDGRIVRFVPAYRAGFYDGYGPGPGYGPRPRPYAPRPYDPRPGYGPDEPPPPGYGPSAALPPMSPALRGAPRPPAPVPQVASRTPQMPLPRAIPPHASEAPVAAAPNVAPTTAPKAAPPSQSMAMQAKPAVPAKPAEVAKSPQNTAPAPTDAKPAPQIQPTEAMPQVQGLE